MENQPSCCGSFYVPKTGAILIFLGQPLGLQERQQNTGFGMLKFCSFPSVTSASSFQLPVIDRSLIVFDHTRTSINDLRNFALVLINDGAKEVNIRQLPGGTVIQLSLCQQGW